MKKILAICLALIMVVSMVGCGGGSAPSEAEFKIGLVTGTVSQGEEEFQAGQSLVNKYGADVIQHITYPDRFSQEQETTISQIVGLAADPAMKAIIVIQGVPGTAAAFEQIRETRDDILLIAGVPHEDPSVISPQADFILETDNLRRGETIMNLAAEMGAKTFVHYSFPRHMSYEPLALRRDALKAQAATLGIQFVEVDAPDPTGDAGVTGTQQFVLEDVPRQVNRYGEDTAFFGTNCSMMEPMIKTVLTTGAIFAEQCCPSPYHAYPGALGIEIPSDKAGDVDFIISQTTAKIVEAGGAGRFATWRTPANMAMIWAAGEYAMEYARGNVDKFDIDKIEAHMSESTGGPTQLNPYDADRAANYLLFVGDSVVFGK